MSRRPTIVIAFFAGAAICVAGNSVAAEKDASPGPGETPQVRVEVKVLEWQLNNALDYDFAVAYDRLSPGSVLDSAELNLPARAPLSMPHGSFSPFLTRAKARSAR